MANREDTLPWWKQFWPWFLISIPAGTVVAALITINIAISTNDGLVSENYYKEGLGVHRDAEALQRARQLGIQADIVFAAQQVQMNLQAKQNVAHGTLKIALLHPTKANQDVLLTFEPSGPNTYQAKLPEFEHKIWNVQLSAPEAKWQLHGRVDLAQQQGIVLN